MSHAALKLTDRLTADEWDSATRRESEDRVRYCILAVRQLAPSHSVAQVQAHRSAWRTDRKHRFWNTCMPSLTRLFYSTATLWHYCMVRGITGPWLEGFVPQNSVNMGLMASRTSSWGKWFTA